MFFFCADESDPKIDDDSDDSDDDGNTKVQGGMQYLNYYQVYTNYSVRNVLWIVN